MATKRLRRSRDPIQLGKLIVDIATGQVEDRVEDGRDPPAVEMGRKSGAARADSRSSMAEKESPANEAGLGT